MRRLRKQVEEAMEVDMTPMLDIVFIMLIFFIVTTSFVKENAVTFSRPAHDDSTPPINNKPIVLNIAADGQVLMAGRLLEVEAIQANIESARAEKPKAPVVIMADQAAQSGIVVRAVDQAKLAGVESVTVVKPTN